MSALDKFKKNQPAGTAAKKPATAGYVPRHAGVPSNARDPYLGAGKHVLKVLNTSDSSFPKPPPGRDGYFKIEFEVIETTADPAVLRVGDKRTVTQCVTGKSEDTGKGKVKAMLVALMGFKSDDEIDEAAPNFDEEGRPIVTGWAGVWDAASGDPVAQAEHGANPLAGALVECVATQGKAITAKDTGLATGEYYYNYSWAPYSAE